jgi:hypothetical protein
MPRPPAFALVLLAAAVLATQFPTSARAETVAHWRFESAPGLLADSGPHGLTLSASGTAPSALALPDSGPGAAFPRTLHVPAVANARSASYGGVGHHFRAHDARLAPSGSFTFEAFARRTTSSSGSAYLASRWEFSNGAKRSWGLAVAGSTPPAGLLPGELFLALSPDGVALHLVGSGLVLPLHTDAFVAFSYRSDSVVFHYVDLAAGSGLVTAEIPHAVPSLHLGDAALALGAYDATRNRWTGLIDEARLSLGVRPADQLLVSAAPAAPPPIILTPGGSHLGFVLIELQAPHPDAVLRYTLDDSAPSADSPAYDGPIFIDATATLRVVALLPGLGPSPPVSATYTIRPFPLAGHIRPRPAAEIRSSLWSVGAETLDRGFTRYSAYRDQLGRLGAKAARMQAGWARTEQSPGVYDWSWLDEAVFDAAARGVRPWINVSYGNPIYPGGGEPRLFGSAPSSPQALAAWDAWLDAMVLRYRDVVDTWEIWNEPVGHVTASAYTNLFVRSARIIRARQPHARLVAIAFAGIDTDYSNAFLTNLQNQGLLHLVDEISYHAYVLTPEDHYGAVNNLRNQVNGFDPRITIRQGENGAPSRRGGFGALVNFDWTEQTQAKWNLRRMLGDHGRGIPNNVFSIADMQYDDGRNNDKGLLLTDPATQDVIRPKEAYHAAQHVYSVFDDTLRLGSPAWSVSAAGASGLNLFRHEHADGRRLVTLWIGGSTPQHNRAFTDLTVTLPSDGFADPVWADLRTGRVHTFPAGSVARSGGVLTLSNVPAYDSPVVIAERSLVLRPYDEWAAQTLPAAAYLDPARSSFLARAPDGRALLEHYAFGDTSTAQPLAATDPRGRLRLAFPRLRADIVYTVEVSDDLVTWTPVATDPGQLGETVEWTDTAPAAPRRFARVRLALP